MAYGPIEDRIDISVALVQAATMLDEAGVVAIQSGSIDDMLKVSLAWMEFGVNLLGPQETEEEEAEEDDEDGEEHDLTSETTIMGFGSPVAREAAEQEYEDRKR